MQCQALEFLRRNDKKKTEHSAAVEGVEGYAVLLNQIWRHFNHFTKFTATYKSADWNAILNCIIFVLSMPKKKFFFDKFHFS